MLTQGVHRYVWQSDVIAVSNIEQLRSRGDNSAMAVGAASYSPTIALT
jgi:hypothetical protein